MKILITPLYNTYLEVSGKLLEELVKCPTYKQEYGEGDYQYIRCLDKLEIRTAHDEQIFPSNEIHKTHRDLVDEIKALNIEIKKLKEQTGEYNSNDIVTTEDI